ncbi:hypothetical protein [uncultured Methanobrevibacter sp.]|uniref:hypothetical protein n=1 Tax=uncultured Methanobrevibacter sp. TaxID=253161 RepID=UPI00262BF694|nr:hypothetical protein [uncultured Methanobrevibacter sp.]
MVTYSSKNNVIEINTEEYFKLYKDIIKTCLSDGYVLPGILEVIEGPEKYDYTYEEKLKFKTTEESSNKRQQMMIEHELKYNRIDVPFENQKLWAKEYVNIQNEELLEFISIYPKYESILK